MMSKSPRFNTQRATGVPRSRPTPGLAEQLHRLVVEERPGACVGCGFEHSCATRGCAVLRKISRIVAVVEGGADDGD